jgi:hypothetical protein
MLGRYWWVLLLLAVLMQARLAFSTEPLWYDEAFSVLSARLPLAKLWQVCAADVHPPLYYLLLKPFLALPLRMEVAARLPSLLATWGAMALLWPVLGRLGLGSDRKWALLLAAWMPSTLNFSGEARMYALLSLCFAGAIWALWEGHWWLAGVLGAAMAWMQSAAPAYMVALALLAWVRLDLRRAVGLGVVAGILYLPWLPEAVRQAGALRAHWIWWNGPGTVAYMLYRAIFYKTALDSVISPLALMVLAGMGFWGALRTRREILIAAYGPLAVMAAASMLSGHGLLLHRGVLPSVPFIAATWLPVLRRRDVGRVLQGMLAVFLVLGAVKFAGGKGDARYADILEAIRQNRVDAIVGVNSAVLPLRLYVPDLPIYVVPGLGDILSVEAAEAMGLRVAYPPEGRVLFVDFELLSASRLERTVAEWLRNCGQEIPVSAKDFANQTTTLWLLDWRPETIPSLRNSAAGWRPNCGENCAKSPGSSSTD